MFNVTHIGNRVDISSSDVDFTITPAVIPGTLIPIADIEAEGYNWEVTYSGTYLANVKLISGFLPISGGCHGMTHDRTMIWSPTLMDQSLKEITAMTPTLIDVSKTISSGEWFADRIMASQNYVFTFVYEPVTLVNALTRTKIDTLAAEKYDPESLGNHRFINFALRTESEMYTLEEDWNVTDCFQICKVTWTGGAPIRQVVYSFNVYPTVNDGCNWNVYDIYGIYYFKSGTYEKVIALFTQSAEDYPDVNPVEFMLQFVIYDIKTDMTSDQWITPDDTHSVDLSDFDYNCTPPAFFGNKMIVTVGLGALSIADPHYSDAISRSWFKTFFINIESNTITHCDNWTDSNLSWNWLYEVGGVIDYNTNTYYFEAWLDNLSGYYLFSVNLMGIPSQTQVRLIDGSNPYGYHYFQARKKCYGVERYPVMPSLTGVYDIETNIKACDINVDYSIYGGHYFESGLAVDTLNNMLWSLRSNKLEGKSLIGLASKDITVSWPGGTIPFTYATLQNVHFRILDSIAIVMVESFQSSPVRYQCDIYLLKETV